MRQYVIDELRIEDYEKIKSSLDENFGHSGMTDVYWIPLDPEYLTDIQKKHAECQPFYFTIDLEKDRLSCELLVRTKKTMKCDCIAYASNEQRDWLIEIIDSLFQKNGIIY